MSNDDVRFHCAHCGYETSKRSLLELVEHANQAHPEQTFLCGSRAGNIAAGIFGDNRDCWQKEPNGDRTCTFCGSLHEEDMIDILEHYANGDDGYDFDPSTKSYKFYARRPGVQNASQGGIKFYRWHIDPAHPDHEKRKAIYERAFRRFSDQWRARFPTAE